ncbi:MAG: hypothetical protein IJK97_10955, partial [Thermoguttaceae bacterium]|nr:hypothetical protein [Thermoguttaceae bacterium]
MECGNTEAEGFLCRFHLRRYSLEETYAAEVRGTFPTLTPILILIDRFKFESLECDDPALK